MPRKKIEEKEEELDIKQAKKETFATRWFKDHAVDNATDLKIISDLTARSAERQFMMYLSTGNTEVYAIVFYATFEVILKFLRGQQKKWKDFTIEIANSINVGYTNNDNEDNEKVGNFTPILEYIGINMNIVASADKDDPDSTTKDFIRWKELNSKKNVESYKEIQENAFNRLINEYHVNLFTSEAVIPLFCIFMDHIVNVLKMKFKEAQGTDISEVSINVLGLFDAFYSYDEEENREIIEFQPNIMMKLGLKNDETASE